MKKDTVKRLLRYIGRQKGLLFLSLLFTHFFNPDNPALQIGAVI